jgi:hypothetical protein
MRALDIERYNSAYKPSQCSEPSHPDKIVGKRKSHAILYAQSNPAPQNDHHQGQTDKYCLHYLSNC